MQNTVSLGVLRRAAIRAEGGARTAGRYAAGMRGADYVVHALRQEGIGLVFIGLGRSVEAFGVAAAVERVALVDLYPLMGRPSPASTSSWSRRSRRRSGRSNPSHRATVASQDAGTRTVWTLEPKKKTRRRLWMLVGPIVVLTIVGTITSAFTPALAARHPLLLILGDARNRNLILARNVEFLPFLLVAVFRRMLSDPLYYLLGHFYGDAAVRWLEEKAGWGPIVRVTEKFFAKAAYPMVFLFPGAVVCALAGGTGMSFAWFMVLNFLGTVTAVLVLRAFGDVLGGPVDSLLDFFNRYLWQTTAITIGLVILSIVLTRMEGKKEVPSVGDLEAQLEREGLLDGDASDSADADERAERGTEPRAEPDH